MGLFGKKDKSETFAKLTDFFSSEDLDKMREVIGSKVAAEGYKFEYRGYAIDLMNAIESREKPLEKKELRAILMASGCMTKLEPALVPILKPAIEKMRAFR